MFEDLNKEIIELLCGSLTNEKIAALLNQRLEAYAALQHRWSEKLIFDEFLNYLQKKKKALEYYPSTAIDTMLATLNEIAPSEKWLCIKEIGIRFNIKQQQLDEKSKPYSQRKIGGLLSTLGFDKRRGSHGRHVLIEKETLQKYNLRDT
jgi:hypothetical protein